MGTLSFRNADFVAQPGVISSPHKGIMTRKRLVEGGAHAG